VRYINTGRCKFIDEGRECNFDHPPPTADEIQTRKFLRARGLRVVEAHWGSFTRKGVPVPGMSVDVTGALQAMVIDQGGLQLVQYHSVSVSYLTWETLSSRLCFALLWFRLGASGGGTEGCTYEY
jgi:hypothetical protein